jgi:hypothetical protein
MSQEQREIGDWRLSRKKQRDLRFAPRDWELEIGDWRLDLSPCLRVIAFGGGMHVRYNHPRYRIGSCACPAIRSISTRS